MIRGGLVAVAGVTAPPPPKAMTKVEVLSPIGEQIEPAEPVPGMSQPQGLGFLSPSEGWVVGHTTTSGGEHSSIGVREHTVDGDRI